MDHKRFLQGVARDFMKRWGILQKEYKSLIWVELYHPEKLELSPTIFLGIQGEGPYLSLRVGVSGRSSRRLVEWDDLEGFITDRVPRMIREGLVAYNVVGKVFLPIYWPCSIWKGNLQWFDYGRPERGSDIVVIGSVCVNTEWLVKVSVIPPRIEYMISVGETSLTRPSLEIVYLGDHPKESGKILKYFLRFFPSIWI